MKRILIATLCGLAFGFLCNAFASSSGDLPSVISLQIISSRTLIGFAIGISSFNMKHWSLHGLIMGLIFSIPLAFSGLMAPETEEFSSTMMFVSTVVMGMIYGLLTELITSLVFKAKQS